MPSDLGDAPVLARKAGLAVVDGDERAVILDLDRPAEAPVVLTGSGRAVWDALEHPRTVAAVVAEIAACYGEAPGTVEPSVLGFLDELVGRGLLVQG